MILSFAHAKEAKRRLKRLASPEPWCGPCLDEFGDINDLLPITLWDAHGEPMRGLWCQCCGEEFLQ